MNGLVRLSRNSARLRGPNGSSRSRDNEDESMRPGVRTYGSDLRGGMQMSFKRIGEGTACGDA
jgi:hypothetical protein